MGLDHQPDGRWEIARMPEAPQSQRFVHGQRIEQAPAPLIDMVGKRNHPRADIPPLVLELNDLDTASAAKNAKILAGGLEMVGFPILRIRMNCNPPIPGRWRRPVEARPAHPRVASFGLISQKQVVKGIVGTGPDYFKVDGSLATEDQCFPAEVRENLPRPSKAVM